MAMLTFAHQAQLELFLEQIQLLIDDCFLIIRDNQTAKIIYTYSQTKYKTTLNALKTLVQQHPLEAASLERSELASQYVLTHKKIRVQDQEFAGEIYLFQPMTGQRKHSIVAKQKPSLQDTFHSHSSAMQHMFSIIERVAITEFPVLVRGESGSGKELVAHAIHAQSQRSQHPFIAINCAALNASLLESELFGHVKGAFTGAIREHKGVFERAAGGTLFLDEIAEIPLELQAKLLRVLEMGEFTPLGGEKSIKSNVRIIAATHRALREEAKHGRFRQDLLYRLRVIPIFVPPLRERKEDIPTIAQYLLHEHRTAMQNPVLSDAAMTALMQYDWPGNVRELKNTLLYALAMAHGRSVIDITDLPDEIVHAEPESENPRQAEQSFTVAVPLKIDAYTLQHTLNKYQHDLALTAQALGISRTSLWRYRKKFGL